MSSNAVQINKPKIFSPKPMKMQPFNALKSKSLLFFNEEERLSQDLCDSIKNPFKQILDLNKIETFSYEEIEEDFVLMKTRSEIIQSQREILSIIRDSANAKNSILEGNGFKQVERVKNPFEKNLS